jgi:hypothetical protein
VPSPTRAGDKPDATPVPSPTRTRR